tara:strand:- start:437 stop:598 length:162 start_codon:yes stop_codon:yes gene_type:complete
MGYKREVAEELQDIRKEFTRLHNRLFILSRRLEHEEAESLEHDDPILDEVGHG